MTQFLYEFHFTLSGWLYLLLSGVPEWWERALALLCQVLMWVIELIT